MKNKENLIRIITLLVAILLVVGIISLISNFRLNQKDDATSVGIVLIGASDDNGWNQSHYEGLLEACEQNSCTMFCEELVSEEEAQVKKAVSRLKVSGCSCIFLTSFGYKAYLDELARTYPEIAFYCISGDGEEKNTSSYFARMYQVRYLSGIVAGSKTKSNVLGFVAAMPISETIRSINAYTLGARKANPHVRVLVSYTGSWEDQEKEKAAAKALADAGADVLTYHEDRPYTLEVAEELGIYSTGYDYVADEYSDKFLTASIFKWDVLYGRVLGDYLSGRANFANDYWLGLTEGAVALYPFSSQVTEETKKLVASEEERIQTWRDVFSGEIRDNHGFLRCHEDERIGDDELFNLIDWYVEGVEIYE